MLSNIPKKLRLPVLAISAALVLQACGGSDTAAQKQKSAAAAERPAPVVGVVTVQPQQVVISTNLPGRLEAHRSAEVRAQVGGIIKRRLFQEGSYVKAGQPLYQLDNAVYSANLESARAQLASAQASLAKANADLARYKPLVDADAISKQEYDAAVQAKRAAEASVKSAQAAIKSSQINVNYSRITAPISGFIGQSNVSEGTLVSANDATVLAKIQQTNPLYVNLTQSASSVMKMRQSIADGTMQSVNGAVEVDILMEDGARYAYKGRLLFADPTVDATTGQVTLRAEVPNPDNVLLPGLYVRVDLPQAKMANAFVVPQQAVARGQQDTVMVVNADGTMAPKMVTVSQQQGSNWIITGGLQAGDKVIVEGLSIAAMSGAKKVTPKEWSNPNQVQATQSDKMPAGAPASEPTASSAK